MSLKRRPTFGHHYSQEKIINVKDYSLPTLVKQQELASTPCIHKRFNLEPFKLRVNNSHDKRLGNALETPLKPVKPQNEVILSEEKGQISKELAKQTPINNPIIQNIFEVFQKGPRTTLKKRKTYAYGDFVYLSEQSNDSCTQSIAQSSEQEQGLLRRSKIKKISRKFSLTNISETNTTEVKEMGLVNKRSNFCTKEAKKFMQRILVYRDYLHRQAKLHDISFNTLNHYEDQVIHYSLGKFNNRQVLKDCMNRRWWWKEEKTGKRVFVNFLWTKTKDLSFITKNQHPSYVKQSNESFQQQEISHIQQEEQDVSVRTLHNHFQNNKYLGSKVGLYLSIKQYCQHYNKSLSDYLLPTFYVCRFMDDQWKSFTKAYFQRLQISRIDNWDVNINKKYWMVKQISEEEVSNRVFMTYKQIKQHVEKQCKNGGRFLIQKYISRPFLFKRRKFDIRTYALIVRLKDKINVYLHKEGIISTATELFDMIEIDNPLIHITTEAVQITSKNFGEYEPGNKIDFHAFQSYLNAVYGDKYNFMGQAFPRMQQAVALFVQANCSRLAQSKENSCFQLIQCEFSMDEDFRPWLIDVHTNPPLDTYCVVLERVLPLVIEDTLKHTVDVLFPPPLEWPQSKRHLLHAEKEHHDGFVLIFEEGKEGEQRREAEDIDGVQSTRDDYEDDLLVDEPQNGQCSRLNEIEYLLNQGLLD